MGQVIYSIPNYVCLTLSKIYLKVLKHNGAPTVEHFLQNCKKILEGMLLQL